MKLLHNFVSLGYAAVLAEAAACAERGGIDKHAFIEVLAKGGGGGVILDRLSPYISQGDTSGLRFSVANASKDIGYYLEIAKELDSTSVVAESVSLLYKNAQSEGYEEIFVPEMIRLLSGSGR